MSRGTTRTRAVKAALAGLALSFTLVGVAYAIGVRPFAPASGGSPAVAASRSPVAIPLAIRARNPRQTVAAGARRVYRIRIRRGAALIRPRGNGLPRLAARVRLSVYGKLPPGVAGGFRRRVTRSGAAALVLRTRADTPRGTYRVRLRARGRLGSRGRVRRATTTVTLVVVAPVVVRSTGQPFTIRGAVLGTLAPGLTAPVELILTNPSGSALTVERLEVRIDAVAAPEADAAHPCTLDDFAVRAFSGAYGFELPASSTRGLASLGIPVAQWPQVSMTNRRVNQDGCKNATLSLEFAGVARGGDE